MVRKYRQRRRLPHLAPARPTPHRQHLQTQYHFSALFQLIRLLATGDSQSSNVRSIRPLWARRNPCRPPSAINSAMNLPITPSEAVDPFACPPRPHRALTVHRYLSRHVSRCVRRQHGVRERLSGVARLAKDARGGRQAVTQPPHWHRRP
eukprot:3302253-Pyramimonas_sp.AAC.2